VIIAFVVHRMTAGRNALYVSVAGAFAGVFVWDIGDTVASWMCSPAP